MKGITHKFRKYNKEKTTHIKTEDALSMGLLDNMSNNSHMIGKTFINEQGLSCEVLGLVDIGHEDNDIFDDMYVVKYTELADILTITSGSSLEYNACKHPIYSTVDLARHAKTQRKPVAMIEIEKKSLDIYAVKVETRMLKRKHCWKISFGEPKYKYVEKFKLEDGMMFSTMTCME